MESFCCVNQTDIINNQNFPNSFGKGTSDDKNHTLRKLGKEKLPSSLIKLGDSKSIEPIELASASRIPITSKNVIIKKECDPLNDYEILTKLGAGTYGQVYKVKKKKMVQLELRK